MEKKFKRESRQTGMSDERQKALLRIRELKNSGKTRLQQAIDVRNININIIYRMENKIRIKKAIP